MTIRTGKAAWDHGKTFVGKQAYQGLCKAFVREECFNVDQSRSGTAKEAWAETVHKHPTSNPEAVPAYVWVFMNTSASAEHAVMSGPLNSNGKRLCLSVDAGPNRSIAVVSLASLASRWGPVVGWGEDLDGQRIWTPPAAKASTTVYVSDPGLKQIDSLLQAEIKARTEGSPNRVQLERALALVRDVRNPNN